MRRISDLAFILGKKEVKREMAGVRPGVRKAGIVNKPPIDLILESSSQSRQETTLPFLVITDLILITDSHGQNRTEAK